MGNGPGGKNEDVCGVRFGRALAEYLARPESMSMSEIARRVGKSATYIHDIANGRIVGKETPRREIAGVIGMDYEAVVQGRHEPGIPARGDPDDGAADDRGAGLTGEYRYIIGRLERQVDFLGAELHRLMEENKLLRTVVDQTKSGGENED